MFVILYFMTLIEAVLQSQTIPRRTLSLLYDSIYREDVVKLSICCRRLMKLHWKGAALSVLGAICDKTVRFTDRRVLTQLKLQKSFLYKF